MRINLRSRYTIIILSIIVSVVVLLSAALFFQAEKSSGQIMRSVEEEMKKDLRASLEERATTLVQFVAADLVNPTYFFDMEQIHSILSAVRSQKDVVYVYLFSPDGKIIHEGDKVFTNLDKILKDEISRKAVSAKTLFVQTTDSIMDVSMPIALNDVKLGGIRIGFSLNRIQSAFQSLQDKVNDIQDHSNRNNFLVILVLAMGLCLFGIGAAFLLGQNLSRPITQLAKIASQLGQGDYAARVEINRQDELGDLAQSFRQMANDLQRTTVSKDYVESIIAQMINTLAVVSPQGVIERVNTALCKTLEYSAEELVNQPFSIILGDAQFEQTWLRDVMQMDMISGVETLYVSKGGKKIPVQFSAAPLTMNHGGQAMGLVCVAQDVSRIKMSEKLAAIGKLAASIAHELRNPLGVVQNCVYYFKEFFKNDPVLKENSTLSKFLGIQENEIKRSNKIISDLLDYTREMRLALEKVDMNMFIDHIKATLEIPPAIQFTIDIQPLLPPVSVDPRRLQQVFINMISNAVLAMPNGGELCLKIRLENGAPQKKSLLVIDFQDTGIGISEENKRHLFEPLFSTRNTGTGLGLVISQEIVHAHGGTIHVESTVGKGTNFTVTIPVLN